MGLVQRLNDVVVVVVKDLAALVAQEVEHCAAFGNVVLVFLYLNLSHFYLV